MKFQILWSLILLEILQRTFSLNLTYFKEQSCSAYLTIDFYEKRLDPRVIYLILHDSGLSGVPWDIYDSSSENPILVLQRLARNPNGSLDLWRLSYSSFKVKYGRACTVQLVLFPFQNDQRSQPVSSLRIPLYLSDFADQRLIGFTWTENHSILYIQVRSNSSELITLHPDLRGFRDPWRVRSPTSLNSFARWSSRLYFVHLVLQKDTNDSKDEKVEVIMEDLFFVYLYGGAAEVPIDKGLKVTLVRVPTPYTLDEILVQAQFDLNSNLQGSLLPIFHISNHIGYNTNMKICNQGWNCLSNYHLRQCLPDVMVVEIIGTAFNFSAYYVNYYLVVNDKSNSLLRVLATKGSIIHPPGQWRFPPDRDLTFHPEASRKDEVLIYCHQAKQETLAVASMSMLLEPADYMTWLMSWISYALSGILTTIKLDLWAGLISGLAVLIRQEYPTSEKNRRFEGLHTLMVLGALVLSSGYEGFLTSHIIVPPSPYVIRDLTELLDSGYKIYYRSSNPNSSIRNGIREFSYIFQKTKNSHRLNQSIYTEVGTPKDSARLRQIMGNFSDEVRGRTKVAMPIPQEHVQHVVYNTRESFPGSICHAVLGEPVGQETELWVFRLRFGNRFQEFMNYLDGNGLTAHFIKFYAWLTSIKTRKKVESLFGQKPTELSMNSHIISVFHFYGICVGVTLIVFGIEARSTWKSVVSKTKVTFSDR